MPQHSRRVRLEAGNWTVRPSGGGQASSAGMERGRASVAPPGWAVVMEEEPAQRLVCRRRGLRKRHQDDRHRDAADLTAHVEQRTASDSNPGGRLPAGLRANANPFAERLPEHLDRQAWVGKPSAVAAGPFAGLQGGAVASLLTAEVEALANCRAPAMDC